MYRLQKLGFRNLLCDKVTLSALGMWLEVACGHRSFYPRVPEGGDSGAPGITVPCVRARSGNLRLAPTQLQFVLYPTLFLCPHNCVLVVQSLFKFWCISSALLRGFHSEWINAMLMKYTAALPCCQHQLCSCCCFWAEQEEHSCHRVSLSKAQKRSFI